MKAAGDDCGNRQGNRRPPPGTPKPGRPKKRMRGSGSGSEPAAVAAEGDDETREVAGKCSECGREFFSMKALFGHMRCHPERNWRGINPPATASTTGGRSGRTTTVEQEVAASLVLLSGLVIPSNVVGEPVVDSSSPKSDNKADKGKEKEKEKEIVPVPVPIPSPTPPPPSPEAAVSEEVVSQGHFECSGCKRVFESHQALGGHRASHKTIKGCYAAGRHHQDAAAAASDRRDQNPDGNVEERKGVALMVLERTGGSRAEGEGTAAREYKCCVCSKVFSTGQALGGHMRWHLERNQFLGLASAAAAAASATSSSQLSWGFSRGQDLHGVGSSSIPHGTVGSLYSTGKMVPYLAMKQDQQGAIPPQQGQGHGVSNNPLNMNPGGWRLGRDGAGVGSSSNFPQVHGGSLFPTTTGTTTTTNQPQLRWINPGGRQQKFGFGGTSSSAEHNQAQGGQSITWLAGNIGDQQHESGGSSANPQRLAGATWLQPTEEQQQIGIGSHDGANFPSTHGLLFQRGDMHGLNLNLSSSSGLLNLGNNNNYYSDVNIEETRGIGMTSLPTNQGLTGESWQLEAAQHLDVATSSTTVQVLAAQQEHGVGTLSTPAKEEEEEGGSSSSSSEIDLELKLGR